MSFIPSSRPEILDNVSNYLLHLLLDGAPLSEFKLKGKNLSLTEFKPQVVERETIFVPVGWDSWGKIKILNEKFNCQLFSGMEPDGFHPALKEYNKLFTDKSQVKVSDHLYNCEK